jgi:hypothetical protein
VVVLVLALQVHQLVELVDQVVVVEIAVLVVLAHPIKDLLVVVPLEMVVAEVLHLVHPLTVEVEVEALV